MKSLTVNVVVVFAVLLPIVHAEHVQEKRAFDVILQSLGFGPCTDQPKRCGYKDRGYSMIKFDDDSGLCTEICSTMPYLNVGYQCGACTGNGREICPDESTISCLQGLGVKMFDIDDNGICNEICVFGSTRREGYNCGECENAVPLPPVVRPTSAPQPAASPTRQPVAAVPVSPPNPVAVPVTVTPIAPPVPVVIPVTPPVPVALPVSPPQPVINPTSLRYDITLDLVNMSDELRATFDEAKAVWEGVVAGDLPDVLSSDFTRPPIFPECSYPDVVDDLYICATLTDIDGLGGVAGSALPTFARTDAQGSLPSAGAMRFDTADIESLQTQGLTLAVISHEMGHVLGIGSTWEFFGVIGSVENNCPYMGEIATSEYRAITGCDTIPIEQEGSTGSSCRHWSETCLDSELMSPVLDENSNPLSRVTIGSLADLGYAVDYTRAEPFTRDDIDPSCLCTGRQRRQLRRQNSEDEQLSTTNFQGKHGDVVLLNDLIPDQRKDNNRVRRKLSEDLRQYALSYGMKILNENAASMTWASAVLDLRTGDKRSRKPPERARYVGQYYMSVIMRQGDDYFGVLVVRDEN